MTPSLRHVLPGFGYVPDDPAGSPMSGIAAVAYHLAREAARAGHETSLVSFSNGRDRAHATIDGVAVRRVRHRRWLDLPRVDLSYAGPVAWLGVREAVDVAHVHSNPYLLRPLRARRRILHYHTPDFRPLGAYRRAVARADAIVFVSAALRDRYLALLGDPACPVHVVPNGVVVERFLAAAAEGAALRRRFGIAADAFVVLFAGHFTPEKGLHVLVEAVARARALTERPVALLVVGSSRLWQSAGAAPAVSAYERELVAGADPALVTFAGALPQREMPAAYAAADLVVCPSIWPEPYPGVILEAMASAKPVVGSRVGGIPELVRDGETGLLVPADDAGALAAAIAACAADPTRRAALGAAGRRRAREQTWDRVAGVVHAIYADDRAPSPATTRSVDR